MEKDSHRFIAANDNELPRSAPLQGEFNFCQSPGKEAAPSPAKASPTRARKSAKQPAPAIPGASAECGIQLGAKCEPASLHVAPPEPDMTPGTPNASEVVSLKRERIARHPRIRELNEIADQAMKFMRDRALMAEIADTLQEEDAYYRHWSLSGATYARVLAAIEKHTEFLSKAG